MEKLLSLFIGEILIERGDERGRVNAMHKAGFGDGFQRGMRAIHEHRSDFGVHAHHFGNGHFRGNHREIPLSISDLMGVSLFLSYTILLKLARKNTANAGKNLLQRNAVLHAVAFFGALGVVEAVKRADQIARNAAYAVKRLILIMIRQLDVFAVQPHVDRVRFAAVELLRSRDVSVDFFLRAVAAGYIDSAHSKDLPYLVDVGIIIPLNVEK